jgi:hypothetical protein
MMTFQEVKTWLFGIAYGLDLTFNAATFGSPRETFSSRCYRMDYLGYPTFRVLRFIIDLAARPFDGAEHCKQSYENICNGVYLPQGFHDLALYSIEMDQALAMNADKGKGE